MFGRCLQPTLQLYLNTIYFEILHFLCGAFGVAILDKELFLCKKNNARAELELQ